ncbi:Dyp-type peroxidase [Coprinopsis marcescibilis]|uniref:Dyp-type peroxidase n=1 Tax=Coprinopsis marcescibilis TaxID=230819 RepID=A0A5C3KJT0_COPMA|nr:Dyp-type peroxidase [Coprinopsis marcescibilis]
MTTPPTTKLNLDNIQGDILSGIPKKTELYYFFQILDTKKFRVQLGKLAPIIKTAAQVLHDRKCIEDHKKRGGHGLIQIVGVNVSFSHLGFQKLGINDSTLFGGNTNDPFSVGQLNDAVRNLGDPTKETPNGVVPDWEKEFLQPIHGLILIAGESHATTDKKLKEVEAIFGVGSKTPSVKKVKLIRGDVRPGKEHAHEHFGFLDGVSNPSVIGFDPILPGPAQVRPGILLTGQDGDPIQNREPWAVDGSFQVFRYLFQEVPEFHKYLRDNPLKFEDLTPEEGSELLGARMVGRWRSGAPIDVTPFKDDPKLAKDPQRNNDFKFKDQLNSQQRCPFAAHVRKTMPRDDLESLGISVESRRIARRGIQFGPEVTPSEKQEDKTQKERGLLFVCYQSSISNGFQFMQQSWANNANFPFGEQQPEVPGLDPLIGRGTPRKMSGLDPNDATRELTFPDFIIPRGGEYFFTPSIKALKETLSEKPPRSAEAGNEAEVEAEAE